MEKIFHRGSRCYGTSINNTGLIFIHGIHSWTNAKMKEFIHSKCKKFNINILSVKRITKFNDSFLRIKVYTPNFNLKKFKKVFKKALSGVKISYRRCSKWNHKVSFLHLKQNLISNNKSNDINTVNLSSTNLVNVNNGNHEQIALNIPNLYSQNPFSHSNTGKFSFCLNHPSILLGDFNMSTSDLQDKLSNSNLDNWFILPINGSPISWTRGSFFLQILIMR